MKLICAALLISLLHSEVLAGEKGSHVFTNHDLDKYKNKNELNTAVDPAKTRPSTVIIDDIIDDYSGEKKLKRYVIPYSGEARRIIIPVTFNRGVTAPMLLDTGAPGMHISSELANKLGLLDNDEAKLLVSIGGVGGITPAVFTILDSIRVGEAEDNFIPTYISPMIFRGFEGLVGMDFMGKYSVEIDTKKRHVILEELPESSRLPAGHDESWWRTTFNNFKTVRSAWKAYRESVSSKGAYTDKDRRIQKLADQQFRAAERMYDRLNVYASEHSVPLEWR